MNEADPSIAAEARGLRFTRLVTFTDAVLAIATTLMFVHLLPPRTWLDVYEWRTRASAEQRRPVPASDPSGA